MTLDLGTGTLGANPNPTDWRSVPLDEAAAAALMGTASLVINPEAGFYATRNATDMAGGVQYPSLAGLVSTQRNSQARDFGWSLRSGGQQGQGFETAANLPRVGARGCLIEPIGTNGMSNPRGEGAPDHWVIQDQGGASLTFEGSGVAGGKVYTEWLWAGAPTGDARIVLESANGVPAQSGQTWTISAGVQIIAGSLSNMEGLLWRLYERDETASPTLSAIYDGPVFRPDHVPRGQIFNATLNESNTTHVQPYLQLERGAHSGPVNIRFRLYAPQLEQSAYASSAILPDIGVRGAATRDKDIITLPVGNWLALDGVTVMARFSDMRRNPDEGRQNMWSLDDGTFNNILNCYVNSAGLGLFRARNAGGSEEFSGLSFGTVPETDEEVTVVSAFGADNVYVSSSLGAQDTDSALSVAMLNAATTLRLGADPAGRPLNGYLRELRLWPYRLSDADCDRLSGLTPAAAGANLLETV